MKVKMINLKQTIRTYESKTNNKAFCNLKLNL